MALTPATRERLVERLCEHFAHDHLTVEELERRLDIVQRTSDLSDAEATLRDLPNLPVRAGEAEDYIPAPSGGSRTSSVVLSLMGGTERGGAWQPAQRVLAMAVMGGTDLDFREARLPEGVTEVYVLGLMGGVDIVIPPDLPVEVEGMGIMGGFGRPAGALAPTHPGVPQPWRGAPRLLRIRGLAFMGGVDVTVRLPGESASDARRRRRLEAKQRRQGRLPGSGGRSG